VNFVGSVSGSLLGRFAVLKFVIDTSYLKYNVIVDSQSINDKLDEFGVFDKLLSVILYF
jgi:hypothetical protein